MSPIEKSLIFSQPEEENFKGLLKITLKIARTPSSDTLSTTPFTPSEPPMEVNLQFDADRKEESLPMWFWPQQKNRTRQIDSPQEKRCIAQIGRLRYSVAQGRGSLYSKFQVSAFFFSYFFVFSWNFSGKAESLLLSIDPRDYSFSKYMEENFRLPKKVLSSSSFFTYSKVNPHQVHSCF
jgi:hypothetical protein